MSWKHVLPVLFLAPAMAFAQAPSDPQIAGIVVTANQIDIEAGKLAKAQSKTKEVQDFAQQMITDHTAVNKQAAALAQKLGVKPEDSETSKSLKQAAADATKKLKGLKGKQFDKVLIPSAQNAELKALIVKVRPAIATHLEHAKHLQASLGKKK